VKNIIERKCAHCKNTIEINSDNIGGVLQFQLKYYHYNCFEELATKKANSKRGKPEVWREALNNICELEDNTKQMLESAFAKDELNEWLLNNYDIAAVPSRFWQVTADLARGVYKGKKCRPISVKMLVDVWKWGQVRLNKINAKNKTIHNGPQNDIDRLRYDLAVLISHVNDYIKSESRAREESEKIKNIVRAANKINYEHINVSVAKEHNDDNILDLMNEIF
jgi:hypothetical protein